jgi:site-specific DNA recombinase
MENLAITKKQIDENIIQIFVPLQIRKRGGAAMLILPQGQSQAKNFDDKLLKAFAKAYQWKTIIKDEENDTNSLADIARLENISTPHVTKIYRLNFISPKIVEAIIDGAAHRELRLQDIFAKKSSDIWQEQEEKFGF